MTLSGNKKKSPSVSSTESTAVNNPQIMEVANVRSKRRLTVHPAELRKKLKPLIKQQHSDNSSLESFQQKVDLNKRTKRRGTMFPGALLKQFKDASQLPEVGLEDEEEENQQKILPTPIRKKKNPEVSVRAVKIASTPPPSPEDSSSNNHDAPDEIQRANELLKKFDTIQARIKRNLENIQKQEETRYSIAAEKHECCCTTSPVTTNVVVQKIMEEIARNRALHPEYVVDGDVKQLRTEIGQYKTVLKHVNNVNEAVEKTEEVLMKKQMCCPGRCGFLLKAAGERKETGVQYEKDDGSSG